MLVYKVGSAAPRPTPVTYVKSYHWPGQLYGYIRRQLCLQVGSSLPANPNHALHVASDRHIYAAWICHSRRWDTSEGRLLAASEWIAIPN